MKRGRIKPTNPERRAKKFDRNFGPKADWIRSFPCVVCGRHSEAAHAIPTGMGGANADSSRLVPLCRPHHRESVEYRTSARAAFEVRHGLTRGQPGDGLVLLAADLEARYQAGEDAYGAPF